VGRRSSAHVLRVRASAAAAWLIAFAILAWRAGDGLPSMAATVLAELATAAVVWRSERFLGARALGGRAVAYVARAALVRFVGGGFRYVSPSISITCA